mmetsp:Transcript_76663/g.219546  ORF Transcript_76663/g.219546 Transcript_76663/m.219546 type:complete len:100 (-) Transcript_76663:48-347(-)
MVVEGEAKRQFPAGAQRGCEDAERTEGADDSDDVTVLAARDTSRLSCLSSSWHDLSGSTHRGASSGDFVVIDNLIDFPDDHFRGIDINELVWLDSRCSQ